MLQYNIYKFFTVSKVIRATRIQMCTAQRVVCDRGDTGTGEDGVDELETCGSIPVEESIICSSSSFFNSCSLTTNNSLYRCWTGSCCWEIEQERALIKYFNHLKNSAGESQQDRKLLKRTWISCFGKAVSSKHVERLIPTWSFLFLLPTPVQQKVQKLKSGHHQCSDRFYILKDLVLIVTVLIDDRGSRR